MKLASVVDTNYLWEGAQKLGSFLHGLVLVAHAFTTAWVFERTSLIFFMLIAQRY
jgi:hypothetical protein